MNISTRTRETEPQQSTHAGAAGRRPGAWGELYRPARLGQDFAYVLPGFVLAVLAFSALVPLTALSVSTLVIWVGALLLPLTLTLATAFADLSRARLRAWGGAVDTPSYVQRGPGMLGLMRLLRDPRRWLDLLFETLVAFPLRVATFSIGVTWSAMALGGTTWLLWGYFLPRDDEFPEILLRALSGGTLSPEFTQSYATEGLVYTTIGLVALLTLPLVMRGLALLDATVTRAALSGSARPADLANRGAAGTATPSSVAPSMPERWAWIAAGYAVVTAIAVGWPLLSTLYSVHVAIAMVLIIAHAAAMMCAIRLPAVAIALGTTVPAVVALVTLPSPGTPWPWPVTLLIVQSLIVLIVAFRHSWQWVLAAWLLPIVAVIAPVLVSNGGAGFTSGAISNMVVSSSVSLGAGLFGIVIGAIAENRGALRHERAANAELDAKQRELAERNLVARELHDVVAHSMSVVSVQATTAKYRIPELGEAAEAEFAAIAQSSRQALNEMRGLLATLRDRDGTAPLVPQPTLAELPALIEASRQSGATISYSGEHLGADDASAGGVGPAQIPASTALTAYRITQEALSNAMRHSPGAAIDVDLRATADALTVLITNTPATAAAVGAAGSGLGLAGLRERVAALGGTIESGPLASGGFSVRATLPL